MDAPRARKALTGLSRVHAAAFVSDRIGRRVPFPTLQHWERTGLLRRQAPGRRRPSCYTIADLVRLEAIATLRRDGVSLQRVRRGVRELVKLIPNILDRPGDWRLAVTGSGEVVRLENPDTVLQLTRQPGQLAILDGADLVRAALEAVQSRNGAA